MPLLKDIKNSVLHLLFPQVCAGCGSSLESNDNNQLCFSCHEALPRTYFHLHSNNPIEKLFWGRLPIVNATAQFYFTKESLVQQLMHRFKYKGDKKLGLFLGRLMGYHLKETNRFSTLDVLVPLPLFPSKERRRGYNQATILCEGISEVLQRPLERKVVARNMYTESQTKKNRIERWQNMEGRFELINEEAVKGKHILLVDDVITTGATLEACGHELLKADGSKLSIAALCFSS